ncbi:hypothetical protein DZD18_07270 [Rhodobacteraceae bacterium W635]|uniref:DUF5665 domain-containing protein n=1 Tax=Nioella halotolerans TaxID=2303578 RepID=UPI000E3C2852|nr:hypothetical protein DZD18_07270 [Rhodobacteraceae bacterium W635]
MSEKEEALNEELRLLRDEVRQITAHRLFTSQSTVARIVAISLARGLAFGLGSVIGASFLVSLLVYSLSQIDFIPVLGDWAARIADQIQSELD